MITNPTRSSQRRIMAERPPSSYGSMCSEDLEEMEDVPQPLVHSESTGIQLQRPDSPETVFTTRTHQSSIRNGGIQINNNVRKPESFAAVETIEIEEEAPFSHREWTQRETEQSLSESSPTPSAETGVDELALPYIFSAMVRVLLTLSQMELLCFVRSLRTQNNEQLNFPQLEQEGELDVLGVVDLMHEKWKKGEALQIAIRTLNDISKQAVANVLEEICRKALVQYELRMNNIRRHYSLYEGACRPGEQRFIGDVYVEPPIFIDSPGNPVISSRDLFKPLEGEERIRVVVTAGVPAIGLTVMTQKFTMDSTYEDTEQEFQYVFALPGRDLHLVRSSALTFLEFLASFYPETRKANFLMSSDCSVLFVIDAFELCKVDLNFQDNLTVSDITTSARVETLLTSLIKGDLLPHACIWITAHHSAARKIPANYVSRFTVVRGFEDAQKDEYFTKRMRDQTLGIRVLERVKSSPALYEACCLPLFCWIVSFSYERQLRSQSMLPVSTLTTFYVQYVIVQTNRKIERYYGTGLEVSQWKDKDRVFLTGIGQLALSLLCKRKEVFFKHELKSFGLELDDVTDRGGISSDAGGPASGNEQSFCFVHHSIQSFMAAIYVYIRFRIEGEIILPQCKIKKGQKLPDLYKPAIELMLSTHDGRLDLFLRFLLGLATPSAEMHLRGLLLPQYHPEAKGIEDVIKHIQEKVKSNSQSERGRNLQLCLIDLEER